MIIYYDRDGKPIDTLKWAKLLEDSTYLRVADDLTKDGRFRVSTVWLGLDQTHGDFMREEVNPTPIIFETMVFDNHRINSIGTPDGVFQERYCTEAEALTGHEATLARYELISSVGKILSKK